MRLTLLAITYDGPPQRRPPSRVQVVASLLAAAEAGTRPRSAGVLRDDADVVLEHVSASIGRRYIFLGLYSRGAADAATARHTMAVLVERALASCEALSGWRIDAQAFPGDAP